MKLWSDSWANGERIPEKFGCGRIDPAGGVAFSANVNPHLAWSDLPAGTQSLVLICHDFDVPSQGDDVNKEGREIAADLPRVDFFHWLLADIPASVGAIAEGAFSSGFTARGKAGPAVEVKGFAGARQGLNDYTGWFAGNPELAGEYFGYDGPFPPWNDSLVHHYLFTLYALGIGRAPVEGKFSGAELRGAIDGHVLGEALHSGSYTLNRRLLRS
ncbi:MAG: YbhB/YbcL family Raf kinase inhibitor-like protein [Caldimonas sp.]